MLLPAGRCYRCKTAGSQAGGPALHQFTSHQLTSTSTSNGRHKLGVDEEGEISREHLSAIPPRLAAAAGATKQVLLGGGFGRRHQGGWELITPHILGPKESSATEEAAAKGLGDVGKNYYIVLLCVGEAGGGSLPGIC